MAIAQEPGTDVTRDSGLMGGPRRRRLCVSKCSATESSVTNFTAIGRCVTPIPHSTRG